MNLPPLNHSPSSSFKYCWHLCSLTGIPHSWINNWANQSYTVDRKGMLSACSRAKMVAETLPFTQREAGWDWTVSGRCLQLTFFFITVKDFWSTVPIATTIWLWCRLKTVSRMNLSFIIDCLRQNNSLCKAKQIKMIIFSEYLVKCDEIAIQCDYQANTFFPLCLEIPQL